MTSDHKVTSDQHTHTHSNTHKYRYAFTCTFVHNNTQNFARVTYRKSMCVAHVVCSQKGKSLKVDMARGRLPQLPLVTTQMQLMYAGRLKSAVSKIHVLIWRGTAWAENLKLGGPRSTA